MAKTVTESENVSSFQDALPENLAAVKLMVIDKLTKSLQDGANIDYLEKLSVIYSNLC